MNSSEIMDAAIQLKPVDRVPNAPFYEAPICRYFGTDFRSALLQDRPMADAHLTALAPVGAMQFPTAIGRDDPTVSPLPANIEEKR